MIFEVKMYGESSVGKWSKGILSVGQVCKVASMFNIKTDKLSLEKGKTYQVKNISFNNSKSGKLYIELEI